MSSLVVNCAHCRYDRAYATPMCCFYFCEEDKSQYCCNAARTLQAYRLKYIIYIKVNAGRRIYIFNVDQHGFIYICAKSWLNRHRTFSFVH